jgi:hypothetical protein
VPQHVRVDLFAGQGGTSSSGGGGGGVGVHPLDDGVAAEPSSGLGAEQRVAGPSGPFGKPAAHDLDHRAGEGHGSVFAAFAFAGDVGAVAEGHVGAVEADQL